MLFLPFLPLSVIWQSIQQILQEAIDAGGQSMWVLIINSCWDFLKYHQTHLQRFKLGYDFPYAISIQADCFLVLSLVIDTYSSSPQCSSSQNLIVFGYAINLGIVHARLNIVSTVAIVHLKILIRRHMPPLGYSLEIKPQLEGGTIKSNSADNSDILGYVIMFTWTSMERFFDARMPLCTEGWFMKE